MKLFIILHPSAFLCEKYELFSTMYYMSLLQTNSGKWKMDRRVRKPTLNFEVSLVRNELNSKVIISCRSEDM